MVSIYYSQVSQSVNIIDNNFLNLASSSYYSYNNITLEVTASAYETSGSTFNSTVGDLRVYIKSGSNVLVSYPIGETSIYYTDNNVTSSISPNLKSLYNPSIPVELPLSPLPQILGTNYTIPSLTPAFTSVFNYSFTTNDPGNTSFKMKAVVTQSVGDKYATGSIVLTSAFTEQSKIDINAAGNLYRFIATSSLEIDVPPYLYYFSTGSTPTSAATNLATTINRAISGSSASSSIDLIYASGSGATLILSGSLPGDYANGITLSTVTESLFPLQTTLGGGTSILLPQTTSFINTSQSLSGGTTLASRIYNVEITGSGLFYTSSLSLTNTQNQSYTFITASNTILTASIFIKENSGYTLEAKTDTIPYIALTYASMPIADSGSVDAWNTYLNISASTSFLTGSNSVYLLGGDLPNITELNIPSASATNFYSFGLKNLLNCILEGDKKSGYTYTTPPILINSPLLSGFDVKNNNITGSVLNFASNSANFQSFIVSNNKLSGSISDVLSILPSASIRIIDVSSNYLTGSIPVLSQSLFLETFDCSYNQLSSGIPSLAGNYSLQYFYCNSNSLTGSIPALSNAISLHEFDCSYNILSGSIPNISSNYVLTDFNCSSNYLTGSTPDLYNNSLLVNLDCSNNRLSGSISNLTPTGSYSSSLVSFNCVNNALTGSIPSLNSLTKLEYFYCNNNKLSGSIPNLNNNIVLTTFDCSNNLITGYTSSIVPSTLLTFNASSNLLSTTDIDNIISDFYLYGGNNGVLILNGSGNSAPSYNGYQTSLQLQNEKGWIISTNYFG